MKTKLNIHPVREIIVVTQGDKSMTIDLRNAEIQVIGQPSKEQLESQPLALMALITSFFRLH